MVFLNHGMGTGPVVFLNHGMGTGPVVFLNHGMGTGPVVFLNHGMGTAPFPGMLRYFCLQSYIYCQSTRSYKSKFFLELSALPPILNFALRFFLIYIILGIMNITLLKAALSYTLGP